MIRSRLQGFPCSKMTWKVMEFQLVERGTFLEYMPVGRIKRSRSAPELPKGELRKRLVVFPWAFEV